MCFISFYRLTGFQKFSKTRPLAHSPMTLMGRLSLAADTMAEHIVAAPPMSALMRSIFAEGLMEIPPLWKERTRHNSNSKEEGSNHFLKKEYVSSG